MPREPVFYCLSHHGEKDARPSLFGAECVWQGPKGRVKSLGSRVVLPPDLLSGLDDLRLLGNDAAHIESQAYARVSQEEIEVAIEFTKEVLKAIYQYAKLVSRLRGLKKQP